VKIALPIVVIAVLFFVGLLDVALISPRWDSSRSTNAHGLLPLTGARRQTTNKHDVDVEFWDDLVATHSRKTARRLPN
jgi:hypothetical protein